MLFEVFYHFKSLTNYENLGIFGKFNMEMSRCLKLLEFFAFYFWTFEMLNLSCVARPRRRAPRAARRQRASARQRQRRAAGASKATTAYLGGNFGINHPFSSFLQNG